MLSLSSCACRWLWDVLESGPLSSAVASVAPIKDPKTGEGREKIKRLADELVQQK